MLFGINLDGYGHDAVNQETSSNDRYQSCVLPSKEPCIGGKLVLLECGKGKRSCFNIKSIYTDNL